LYITTIKISITNTNTKVLVLDDFREQEQTGGFYIFHTLASQEKKQHNFKGHNSMTIISLSSLYVSDGRGSFALYPSKQALMDGLNE